MLSGGQILGLSGWGEVWSNNTCFSGSSIFYSLGNCLPKLVSDLIPATNFNQLYTPDGTALIRCGLDIWNFTTAQQYGLDRQSILSVLPSDDYILDLARDLVGL